ncbi:MAG: hypothetical protein R3A48_26345 [Polyangiales bacterium]
MSLTQDSRLSLNLQSDPRWLALGIAGTLAASNGLFIWLFSGSRLHPALGLLPGMSLAVFAGSVLAYRARRRGGELRLEANAFRVELRDPDGRRELLDLAAPMAAALVRGLHDGRRMLVVSQRDEPTVVIEQGRGTRGHDDPAWVGRTLRADLDAAAISGASAGAVTLAEGGDLDPLLAHVAAHLDADAPWLLHPTPGGEMLTITAREISLGGRSVKVTPDLKVLDYAIGEKGAAVAAIGVAGDEGALLLIGGDEAPVIPGAVASDLVPDVYLPMTGFELVRLLVNAAIAEVGRGG